MAWWRKRHRCWLKEIWLRWLQRVMKSEKHAVTVMNLHCNYVFKTFAGRQGVLLKVFQKKVWKILKRAFDKCKKRDILNDHAKNMMLFDKKSCRMKQVEKIWKKFKNRLDNAKMCDILSDHAKQSMVIIRKEKQIPRLDADAFQMESVERITYINRTCIRSDE